MSNSTPPPPRSGDTNFQTVAMGFYEVFAPLYAFFVAKSNPNDQVTLYLDNAKAFREKYNFEITFLATMLDLKILDVPDEARELSNSPAHLRFIVPNLSSRPYLYVGDVDIMMTESASKSHEEAFADGLPYSNIQRPNTERLTGLHYTRADSFHIEDRGSIPKKLISRCLKESDGNDENLLYRIVKTELGEIRNSPVGRPVLGLHMSINRLPFSLGTDRPDWGLSKKLAESIGEVIYSAEFRKFISGSSQSTRKIVRNLQLVAATTEMDFEAPFSF